MPRKSNFAKEERERSWIREKEERERSRRLPRGRPRLVLPCWATVSAPCCKMDRRALGSIAKMRPASATLGRACCTALSVRACVAPLQPRRTRAAPRRTLQLADREEKRERQERDQEDDDNNRGKEMKFEGHLVFFMYFPFFLYFLEFLLYEANNNKIYYNMEPLRQATI